ncbi:hypothetical protein [Victivallis vadensis]|uniref:hypothetical protein n=1 Tax=Victivallis vadensis TaxID=172901 RepID=UPI0011C79558|nr:hypothetical protein [Victivallis vadensis]
MIRVWPVLLALAVWLPLAADETAPAPDAIWINQFDDPGVLEKETRLEGTRFLVPKTKFTSRMSRPLRTARCWWSRLRKRPAC